MTKQYKMVRWLGEDCDELNDAAQDGFAVVPGSVTWNGGWQALVERTSRKQGPQETQAEKGASEPK